MRLQPLELIDRLETRLHSCLPGHRAQRRFAPELAFGRHCGPPAVDARAASVAVILIPAPEGWMIPLILRPQDSPTHAGQVSFPGGVAEAGESVEATALRELHEEIGVAGSGIHLVGRLTPIYVFNSNYLVTPVLGVHHGPARFRPCPSEVAAVLPLPVEHLLDAANFGRHEICRGEMRFEAPHIELGEQRIWGATSMMLGEVIELLEEIGELD